MFTAATETQHYPSTNNRTPSLPDPPASLITPSYKKPAATQPSSLGSIPAEYPYVNISASNQKFRPTTMPSLKSRNLLVATRVALRRQRAALKGPSLQYEPIRSDALQMELANPDESISESNYNAMISSSLSNHTSPLRQDTPHTAPTDISLTFRPKPSAVHPVTGQIIVEHAEEKGNPSPCSYVLPRKSCRERNAPAYTFGTRCFVEKKGGSRTAWQKQWFAHSNPFTTKVDFRRENSWPTPFHYPARPAIGSQSTKYSFPAWSFGARLTESPVSNDEYYPGPHSYDTVRAFRHLTTKSTAITMKSRPGGTQLSTIPSNEITPGPAAYDTKHFLSNRHSAPKHSFGHRPPISLRQDPYVNTKTL